MDPLGIKIIIITVIIWYSPTMLMLTRVDNLLLMLIIGIPLSLGVETFYNFPIIIIIIIYSIHPQCLLMM